MAFVVLQHLDPKRESGLAELLEKGTPPPTEEIRSGVRIRPDRVYVLPSGADLVMHSDRLILTPRSDSRAPHMPIDRFFRSLVEQQGRPATLLLPERYHEDEARELEAIRTSGQIPAVPMLLGFALLRKDGTELPAKATVSIWRFAADYRCMAVVRPLAAASAPKK